MEDNYSEERNMTVTHPIEPFWIKCIEDISLNTLDDRREYQFHWEMR
jgi:hypothetical protein|tara:strand:- start:619 stop:759 length:141 start_codon:yes stop_codon:yes gene_type:complete